MATLVDLKAALDRVTGAVVVLSAEVAALRANQMDQALLDAATAQANAAADAMTALSVPPAPPAP